MRPEAKFHKKDIIGKSAPEIIEVYGKFDHVFYRSVDDKSSDDISDGGYIIQHEQFGIFSRKREKYYMIHFENKVAVRTNIEEGGWGG